MKKIPLTPLEKEYIAKARRHVPPKERARWLRWIESQPENKRVNLPEMLHHVLLHKRVAHKLKGVIAQANPLAHLKRLHDAVHRHLKGKAGKRRARRR